MKKIKLWFGNYFHVLKPYWYHGKFFCITNALWNAFYQPFQTMLYIIFLQVTINQLTEKASLETLLITTSIFIGIDITISLITEALYQYYFIIKEEQIKNQINIETYKDLQNMDYANFDDSDFYNEYTTSYAQYADKAGEAYRFLFIDMLSLIITIITLLIYVNDVSIIIVIATIVSVFINIYIGKWSNRVNIKKEETTVPFYREGSYLSRILSNRDNAMDRKCTNIFDILIDKYTNVNKSIIGIKKDFAVKEIKIASILTLLTGAVNFIIRFVLCWTIYLGQAGVGGFAALLSASGSLSWKLQLISRNYQNMDKIRIYGSKIRNFKNKPSFIEAKNNELTEATISNSNAYDIEFRNVSFSYPNSDFMLNNLNFKIKSGEKIAIVGENGGGKTTLTKLLLRLYDPDSGEIFIDGKSLTEYELKSYRDSVGIAFQEPKIYALPLRDNMSVYQHMDDTMLEDIFEKFLMKKVLEKNNATFDTVLTKEFDSSGIMLSGGEKQKLSIMRIYSKACNLLIFDEPSSALDPIAENQITEMILDKANNCTTILISHRLSTVVSADKIIVINGGEIVEMGNHKELMNNKGLYFEMFEVQAKWYKDNEY